jgi:hypothetical protein
MFTLPKGTSQLLLPAEKKMCVGSHNKNANASQLMKMLFFFSSTGSGLSKNMTLMLVWTVYLLNFSYLDVI